MESHQHHEYNDIIILKVHIFSICIYKQCGGALIYVSYILKQTAKQNTVETCASPSLIPIIAILHEVCIFAEAYDH